MPVVLPWQNASLAVFHLSFDIFGMKTDAQFVNTLEDVIRKQGAMDKLITDSARGEPSQGVLNTLRALSING